MKMNSHKCNTNVFQNIAELGLFRFKRTYSCSMQRSTKITGVTKFSVKMDSFDFETYFDVTNRIFLSLLKSYQYYISHVSRPINILKFDLLKTVCSHTTITNTGLMIALPSIKIAFFQGLEKIGAHFSNISCYFTKFQTLENIL